MAGSEVRKEGGLEAECGRQMQQEIVVWAHFLEVRNKQVPEKKISSVQREDASGGRWELRGDRKLPSG